MGFNDVKVRTRLYSGFSALVLLGIGVAGLGLYQMDQVNTQVGRMDVLSSHVERQLDVVHDLEIIRRAQTRYRLDAPDSAIKEVRDAAAHADRLIGEAAADTVSDARRTGYLAVQATLAAELQNFDRLMTLTKTFGEARTQLLADGLVLGSSINALIMAARGQDAAVVAATVEVERRMMAMRLTSLRYLSTGETNLPANLTTRGEEFQRAIADLQRVAPPTMAGTTAGLRPTVDSYLRNFDAYAAAMPASQTLYDDHMRPQIAEMQTVLEAAVVSLKRDFGTARGTAFGVVATSSRLELILAAVALVIGTTLALLIGRSIVLPVTGMTAVMGRLAAGDHTVKVPARDARDEVGEMARAVEVFREKMIANDRLAAEQTEARAARSRRQDQMERETETFGVTVSATVARLTASADEMRRAAEAMTEVSTTVHAQASSTAESADRSSNDLTAAASAVEQLTSSFAEISHQVTNAAETSRQAVQRAEASQESIRGLANSTARIGDVVRLINDIAGQTNLLALNATIEAARAGDAGKGFAVVAGEVKALASRTAKATDEISGQIDTVRIATEATIEAMTEIGGMIARMEEVSTAIAAAVEQQSVATREIASSIQTVTGATMLSAQSMGQVVVSADHAGSASQQVLAGTASIGEETGSLKTEVERFLVAVRADTGERRRFERLTANDIPVTLVIAGHAPIGGTLKDLSQNGAAVRCGAPIPVGTEVTIELAAAGGSLPGRVVRLASDGTLGLELALDAGAHERVGRVLRALLLQVAA